MRATIAREYVIIAITCESTGRRVRLLRGCVFLARAWYTNPGNETVFRRDRRYSTRDSESAE